MTIDRRLGPLSARLRQKIRHYVSACDYARSAFDNPAPVLDGIATTAGALLLECVQQAQSEALSYAGHAELPPHTAAAFMFLASNCSEMACKLGEASGTHQSPADNLALAADGIAGCAGYLINALQSAPAERAMRLGLMGFSHLGPGITVCDDWTPGGNFLTLTCDLHPNGEKGAWPLDSDSARRIVDAAVALNLAGTSPSRREEELKALIPLAALATELLTSHAPPALPILCGSVEVCCHPDFIAMSLLGDEALIAEATINDLLNTWPVAPGQSGSGECDILPANLLARLQDLGIADAARVVISLAATLLDSKHVTQPNRSLPPALSDATAAARESFATHMIKETCDYLCRYIAQEVGLQGHSQGPDIGELVEELRAVDRPTPSTLSTASIGDYTGDLLSVASMALIANRQRHMDASRLVTALIRSQNVTPFRKPGQPGNTL